MGEFLKMKSYLINIKCHNCGTLNQVKEHAKNLRPICGRCKEPIKLAAGHIIKLQWCKLLNIFMGPWNRFREYFPTLYYYLQLYFWLILLLHVIAIILWVLVSAFGTSILFGLFAISLLLLVISQIVVKSSGGESGAIDIILIVISLALGIPTVICFLKSIF